MNYPNGAGYRPEIEDVWELEEIIEKPITKNVKKQITQTSSFLQSKPIIG